ncbi:MAG: 6-carboxytetrahydropterin synthase [Planctomycetota bacterium]
MTISRTFCAAHQLRLADGSLEPVHGHNWHVRVVVARHDGELDASDCVIDFHDLEARLDHVIGPWDNANLAEQAPFRDGVNASAERVAEAVATGLSLPEGVEVKTVHVTEAPGCEATWHADVSA